MMMLSRKDASNLWRRLAGGFLAIQLSSYSVKSLSSSSSSSSTSSNRIYNRMVRIQPSESVLPILEQWRQEGQADRFDLYRCIMLFRKYRRYNHALEVSEWMSQNLPELGTSALAVHLDLISKVHGLEQAEKFYDNLPESSRTSNHVCGALLNCYADGNSLDKAEATMQNLRDLGFANNALSYNRMMHLYAKRGLYEKVDMIFEEMELKGIKFDAYTLGTRMNAFVLASDIEGMEKFLKKIEHTPAKLGGWQLYFAAANGYLKHGLTDEAASMLKTVAEHLAERNVKKNEKLRGFELILSTYARMENKEEVYHTWNAMKETGRVSNMMYLVMISSLTKLDDMVGAEQILEEWESTNPHFDRRIPNVMISAYCQNGLLQKAVAYVNRLMKNGEKLPASTWDRLATGYCQYNQMEDAVEALRKAFQTSFPGWKANPDTLASCIDYLKTKDEEEATEFIELKSNSHV